MPSAALFEQFGPWGVVAALLFLVIFWHKQQSDALTKTFTNHLSGDIKTLEEIQKALATSNTLQREHHIVVMKAVDTISERQVTQMVRDSRAP